MTDDNLDYIPLDPSPAEATAPAANKKKFQRPEMTADEKKSVKESRKKRRSRIIVRNLSYNVKESDLREWFTKFGTVQEINLLKRAADGKLVGCAFIQYEKVNAAAKAILKTTGQQLVGRPVHCDWAIGKDRYVKHVRQSKIKPKTTAIVASDNDSVKSEPDDSDANDGKDEDDADAVKSEDESDEDDKNHIDDDIKPDVKPPRPKRNDVAEGCTVFIKNVPFTATNDDLQEACKQFGPLYYGLINVDHVSGHSKGTGFVKFKRKESADMCLSAGTEFKLLHQILDPCLAISRNDIQLKSAEAKKKQLTDSRHLYLAKEGLIIAGTPAAIDVSSADMSQRLRLEQMKTQMLKNLNRFVSRDRLSIHNIPLAMDATKLRKIVEQHTKLKPKECRIMRENRPTIGQPIGKSKGFGFLSFKKHADALACLRKLNNNPNIFGKTSRPIVSFSIEDKLVQNIKEKRMQRSLANNPLSKQKKLSRSQRRQAKKQKQRLADEEKPIPVVDKADVKPSVERLKRGKTTQKKKMNEVAAKTAVEQFSGVAAEAGVGVNMRQRWKLKEQAMIHQKNVSEKKKESRKAREERQLLLEKKSVDRTKKRKRGNEVDNFSFMVDKYKKLLDNRNNGGMGQVSAGDSPAMPAKKSKWYVD